MHPPPRSALRQSASESGPCTTLKSSAEKRTLIRQSLLGGLLCASLSGCGGINEQMVLATVGDEEITAAELLDFESRLSGDRLSEKPGPDGYLDYLQTLIDKELMLQEARRLGLDQDPQLRGKLSKERADRIIKRFLKIEVYDKIEYTDEELRELQKETEQNRAVRVRRIVLRTEGEAEEVAAAWRQGADFDELAARTILEKTDLFGGRMLLKDELKPDILQEAIWPLKAGEISDPVFYGDQYGVYQVTEERDIEFEFVRPLIEPELFGLKIPVRMNELAAELKQKLEARTNEAALDLLAERLFAGQRVTDEERQTVLFENTGGAYTVGDFLVFSEYIKMGYGDSRRILDWFAKEVVEPRLLILEAARVAGIDREEEMVSWYQSREQSLLLQAVRREATANVLVDESEARRYYEQNPIKFTPLESVTIREILVADESEAEALLGQIRQGADMGELAARHTLRRQGRISKGEFHIHPFETGQYGPALEAARGAEVGDLLGPVELTVPASNLLKTDPASAAGPHYSIFELLDSTIGAGPEPFAKVERRARALVRRDKADRAFYGFLLELRYENEDRVRVDAENIEKLAAHRAV